MRYIKVLSMFVILAVALLLISTVGTYAGIDPDAVGIVQCDGDLFIVKVDLSDTEADCNTGGG